MHRPRQQSQRGFTLVELLVVIGIIAALAAVVIPNVSRFGGSGEAAANETEVQQVQAAMDIYMADFALASVNANPVETNDFSASDPVLYPGYLRQSITKCNYTWTAEGLVARGTCP